MTSPQPTTAGATWAMASKAICSFAPAFNQHQMKADPARGNTRRGMDRLTPAVVYDDMQGLQSGFASLFDAYLPVNWRGLRSASFSRIPHRLDSSPSRRPVRFPSCCIGHHLPGCAVLAAPGTFHSMRSAGCTRPRANSLPRQHIHQCLADRRHVSVVLSKPSSSAGFKTSWKDLTCEAEPLSSDDKIHD